MSVWPFSRREPAPSTPQELQRRLLEAAGTRRLKRLCRDNAELARANVDVLNRVPEAMLAQLQDDPRAMEEYSQRMIAVAQCLAECGVPELWQAMTGTPETNPLMRWDKWLGEIPQRMAALEYEALIQEARAMIGETQRLTGPAARQYEGYLRGRLGEALFHSGDVDGAATAYEEALTYCREQNDQEGVAAYLGNLREVARYRGDTAEAIATSQELVQHYRTQGNLQAAANFESDVKRLRAGEPPVRAICRLPDGMYELEELPAMKTGVSYKFEFVRNRPSMQKCTELTLRGAQLASDGQLAEALERFDEASEVDPNDPDPIHQSGVALMELGAFDQARDRFAEVHRIAPGWFHCRCDAWLADQLHQGNYPPEVWTVYRGLQDGGLEPPQLLHIARQIVERFDDLAAFWLLLGEAQSNTGDNASALASFRRGLDCPLEPDIESRLRLGLASQLDPDDPERRELLQQIIEGEGNLFAQAVARVMRDGLPPEP